MNKIKELRTAKAWSMDDLAQVCVPTTTASQISKLEKGKTKLHSEWLRKLSKALDCSQAEILGESPPDAVPLASAAPPMTSEQIQALVRDCVLEALQIAQDNDLSFVHTEFAKLAADRARIFMLIRQQNPEKDEDWIETATNAAFDNVVRGLKFGS